MAIVFQIFTLSAVKLQQSPNDQLLKQPFVCAHGQKTGTDEPRVLTAAVVLLARLSDELELMRTQISSVENDILIGLHL